MADKGKKEKGGDKPKAEAKKDAAPKAEAKKEVKDAPKKDAAPAPKKADAPAPKKEAAPAAGGDAGAEDGGADADGKRRAPFRRFFYRGLEVHKLLDLTPAQLMELMHARARRRFARGHVPLHLIRRLRKAKKAQAADPLGKPVIVKTHLRNMIIMPEMVASTVGVYNGLGFTQVEIKPDMIGHYLGEFSITYKPVKHGKPGVGSTGSSRFVPLK
jgi:small subunit ribosomal protein S15e